MNVIFLTSIGVIFAFLGGGSYFLNFRENNLPFLELNEEGVLDCIDFVNYGLIEWNDITDFRMDEKFEDIILIDVTDETKYLNKLNVNRRHGGFYKTDLKNDIFGYGTAVILKVGNLNGEPEMIFDKILHYWKDLKTTASEER